MHIVYKIGIEWKNSVVREKIKKNKKKGIIMKKSKIFLINKIKKGEKKWIRILEIK